LWWGQQIPAYFTAWQEDFVVAEKFRSSLELAKEKLNENSELTLTRC
jgi:valyl-tRNA synthetase